MTFMKTFSFTRILQMRTQQHIARELQYMHVTNND